MTDEEIIKGIEECMVEAQPDLAGLHLEKDTVVNRDLGLDSMNFILVVCKVEAKFGITVPDEDMMELATTQDVIDEIRKCAKEQGVEL